MTTRSELYEDMKGILDRKLKPYIKSELEALRTAQKKADEVGQRLLKIDTRIDSIRAERDRLEAEVEKQSAQGKSPGGQLRDLRIKEDEIGVLKRQAERTQKELTEAEKGIQPAANALDQAIRSRLESFRDEEEARIQGLLDEVALHILAFEDAAGAFYSECGLVLDKKTHGRLLKFYGLNFEALTLHHDNARDAHFFHVKKSLRESRTLKG